MEKGDYLAALLRSPRTVFTFKDIVLLWNDTDMNRARVRVNYYVNKGALYPIRKGLYAKDKNYNRLELATRIFTPSYVSFETVLARSGITFQYYNRIFVASYLSREVSVDGQIYEYKKIKSAVLTNPAGIDQANESAIASKERAFLDTLYSHKDYHFDNLNPLNWDLVFDLLPLYKNRSLAVRVNKLFKHRQKTQGIP